MDTAKPFIQPLFQHDCPCCKYLGVFYPTPKQPTDLWVCLAYSPIGPSVIGRRSSSGPDYTSMAVEHYRSLVRRGDQETFLRYLPSIPEAVKRAVGFKYILPA